MGKVGFQDGLKAAYERIKKIDPSGCNPKYDPDHPDALPVDQLKAWDKVHRTLKILKEDHDAAIPSNGGGGTPPDPPPVHDTTTYAPLAYNEAPGGEPSARYNVHINCKPHGNGWIDNGGRTYDEGGRCLDHRDTVRVNGLKDANSMDGAEAWDPYTWNGTTYPPYPAESYRF